MFLDIDDINMGEDYSPTEGWVLLKKDFGCSGGGIDYPYFILYNKYRGVIRLFMYG